MEVNLPVLKPHIKELNITLIKILCELRTIKTQQQDIINIIKKNNEVPTKEEVSKGWFFS
jgi:hypothetical protein